MDNRNNQPMIAALDVGSNSVRLLVAEARRGAWVPIYQDRVTSRLYQGLKDGKLNEDSIERTAVAIRDLADEARRRGATEVLGFGTSALRDGANRDLLIRRAADCGVPLEVLSGADEAAISYQGAAPSGRAGVIDIGGGSTELLCGEDGRVLASASAQVGAVRLMELLRFIEDPSMMVDAARASLKPAREAIAGCAVDRWVGLGGTITTLAAMQLALTEYDPAAIEGCQITQSTAARALQRLLYLSPDARKAVPGLNPARADIMPFGLAILLAFFDLTGAPSVSACDRDNLIGFLMKKRPETLDNAPEMR